uniref:Uncharacterized protein n=1 Tax=Picea sitchensis TaxID=3332 RepID=A9NW67_PICSI|nr:unknown [Picea sitchensis]
MLCQEYENTFSWVLSSMHKFLQTQEDCKPTCCSI